MKMKMKDTLLFAVILASSAILGLPWATFAQSGTQKATPTKQTKAVKKPHKVWTDEDFASSRSAAATNDSQPAPVADPQQTGTTSQSSKPRPSAVPPVFTNPKSLEEADKMIAWEGRDIDAQQEGLEKLRAQIADAPADQKERLTKVLEQRTQILADTRNELKNLQTKRKELEKPPAGNQTASAEPPSN